MIYLLPAIILESFWITARSTKACNLLLLLLASLTTVDDEIVLSVVSSTNESSWVSGFLLSDFLLVLE